MGGEGVVCGGRGLCVGGGRLSRGKQVAWGEGVVCVRGRGLCVEG